MMSFTKLRRFAGCLRQPGRFHPRTLPLQIEALVKRFGQVTAVDGITLELR